MSYYNKKKYQEGISPPLPSPMRVNATEVLRQKIKVMRTK